jgi:uncharacterized protein YaaQ
MLILAVVDSGDAGRLLDAYQESGIGATSIASTGGFLRRGNATVLAAVPEGRLEAALAIVRRACGARELVATPIVPLDLVEAAVELPKAQVGGGVAFVLQVERHERL